MLEYSPSLESALGADNTNVTWLATELERAGLVMADQIGPLSYAHDAKVTAAILISMVTTKVHCNSENFITFLDVLKKDKATYGRILDEIEENGNNC